MATTGRRAIIRASKLTPVLGVLLVRTVHRPASRYDGVLSVTYGSNPATTAVTAEKLSQDRRKHLAHCRRRPTQGRLGVCSVRLPGLFEVAGRFARSTAPCLVTASRPCCQD